MLLFFLICIHFLKSLITYDTSFYFNSISVFHLKVMLIVYIFDDESIEAINVTFILSTLKYIGLKLEKTRLIFVYFVVRRLLKIF